MMVEDIVYNVHGIKVTRVFCETSAQIKWLFTVDDSEDNSLTKNELDTFESALDRSKLVKVDIKE